MMGIVKCTQQLQDEMRVVFICQVTSYRSMIIKIKKEFGITRLRCKIEETVEGIVIIPPGLDTSEGIFVESANGIT